MPFCASRVAPSRRKCASQTVSAQGLLARFRATCVYVNNAPRRPSYDQRGFTPTCLGSDTLCHLPARTVAWIRNGARIRDPRKLGCYLMVYLTLSGHRVSVPPKTATVATACYSGEPTKSGLANSGELGRLEGPSS
jgi:hypothetical protein